MFNTVSDKGVTYESAFAYFKRELAKVGVTTVKRFKAVLRTIQSRECEDRKRALEAKREAERKSAKSTI